MKYHSLLTACSALLALALVGCSQTTSIPMPEHKGIQAQPVAPLVEHLVFFDWDKDTAPQNVADIITPHVRYLIQHPTRKVLIEGAADETGDYQYNIKLGMRRAREIERHFLSMGVSQNQLIVRSIGIERRLNLEGKAHSLPRNRRVTLAY
ncbi:MAG: hypothetical protein CML22_07490 [Rheinheimera sp.]|nr:hypothetical protein [Rheinheimera sp.]MBM34127.1 hypothetical protein [Rheinheimera sp.]|tara:strand:- start:55 stop:507 length:453 start_codon:yes stop_codon:yes gene_type:complete